MSEPVSSSSKLGKKPKWCFVDDELSQLPSRMPMDSATEFKKRSCRVYSGLSFFMVEIGFWFLVND
ncbi:unnamed protein product [Meloidogyne enterolobii]|uniref:Uncharacterized protein n=1 Tax=Meloidogyne enterolobii TaxID=390850 RepID=A0ACB0XQ29_MELEN